MNRERDPFKQSDVLARLTARESLRNQQRQERHLEDVREIAKIPRGRRLLWNILDGACIFGSTFAAGAPDVSSFREGSRSVGLALLNDLMAAAPESFFQMQREKISERAQDKAEDKLIEEAE